MSNDIKHEESWHAPRSWAGIERTIAQGLVFNCPSKRLKGERVFVLTDLRHVTYGEQDTLTKECTERVDFQRNRYLSTYGRQTAPEDIVYVILRNGRVFAAIRRNGDIIPSTDAIHPEMDRATRNAWVSVSNALSEYRKRSYFGED